jgi:hypothetical protein
MPVSRAMQDCGLRRACALLLAGRATDPVLAATPLCGKHREKLTMAVGGARLTVLTQSGHDEGVTG